MEENSQDFLQKNIPYYEAWDSINFIDLGWSQDKKYLVTKNQTSYILRLFKSDKLTEKQVEFNFIKECHLPTTLPELKSKVEITNDLLKKVADTTNLIKTNPRTLTKEEVYDILLECM